MTPYYQDDLVTLYCGDCREVLADIGPVDHVITDPPYSEYTHKKQWIGAALSNGDKRVSTEHSELGFDAMTDELARFVTREYFRICRAWVLTFCDLESIGMWREDFMLSGLEYVRACIWDKVDSAPQFTGDRPASSAEAIICAHRPGKKAWNGGGSRNVFRHATNAIKGSKEHPSTKPEALMLELVTLFTDAGDVVLDPFAGSGTTLHACKRVGRKAIGIEMQEKWCEVSARRLSQGTLSEMFQ